MIIDNGVQTKFMAGRSMRFHRGGTLASATRDGVLQLCHPSPAIRS
jgi:hypothetical protein